jgi:hypothetical protein
LHLALELQTKLDEESDSRCEVVDNDADVAHPLKRHVSKTRPRREARAASADSFQPIRLEQPTAVD